MPFFKVFWYDSTRGINPRSTDCEADALTTTPSLQLKTMQQLLYLFVAVGLPEIMKDLLVAISPAWLPLVIEIRCGNIICNFEEDFEHSDAMCTSAK